MLNRFLIRKINDTYVVKILGILIAMVANVCDYQLN